MPFLTPETLITDTGEVDRVVYGHMVRRRALNEYGSLAPRALRRAVAYYADLIPILIAHRLAQKARGDA